MLKIGDLGISSILDQVFTDRVVGFCVTAVPHRTGNVFLGGESFFIQGQAPSGTCTSPLLALTAGSKSALRS